MGAEPLTILLVDDHEFVREGVRRLLEKQPGWQVVGEAACGEAAFSRIGSLRPDIVVMDIQMPGLDGLETSARIRQDFPETKIIVLSAHTELATIKRALHLGISAYITKSGNPEELLCAIRAATSARVYLGEEVSALVLQDYMKVVVDSKPASKPVLSEREQLLLKLIAEGKRNKEIAEVMRISHMSAETYRSRLMRKLNCTSTAELTRHAIREGIAAP
jgi:DNA-binding NarL/FixJ family response regulator